MALRNDINAQFKSDLINYTSAIDGQAYILLGETVMGDTPSRIYFYDAASSATADGENVITATGMGVGRFIKNPIQQANVDWNASSGMTQILNKPTLGSGTVTSIGVSSSSLAVSGSPVTGSGVITINIPAKTFSTVSRSLVTTTTSTGFQISSTLDYNVSYSVYAQVTSALIGTNTADVFLEIANTNSTTPGDWTTIARSGISIAGIVSTSGNTQTLSGFIAAGKFVRIRTLAAGGNAGSAVFTYQVGQENSY